MTVSATNGFRTARDLLLAHRTDYESARREFAWPELDEFNWALDWFDVIAAEHPDRPGLRIVSDSDSDGGSDVSLSYGSLSAVTTRSPSRSGCSAAITSNQSSAQLNSSSAGQLNEPSAAS